MKRTAAVPSGRTAILLGLLMAVAFVIRIDALRNDAPPVPAFGDGHAYQVLGEDLAHGDGYIRPYDFERAGRRVPTAEYPPALPAVLAVATRSGVAGATGQRTLLCLVGALTVGLVGLVGRRLAGEGAGLLAAAVAAVHPALINNDVSLAAEPLASLLGAATLVAALAVWDRPAPGRWGALGAVLGIGSLVRAEFLLLVPVLLVALAWRHRGLSDVGQRPHRVGASEPRPSAGRPAVMGMGVTVLVVILVLAPWTIRNAATFGRFVPVSNNLGSVLRGANCDLAYHGQFKGLWVTNVGDGAASTVDPGGACFSGFPIRPGVNEADAAAELRADGLTYLTGHPGDVPGVLVARLGRTVGLYRFDQQAGFAAVEGRDPARERRGTRAFQAFALVGLAGMAAGGWRRRERLLLLSLLGVVLVTVAVTYGNPRFRSTAEPAVVVLAVIAVVDGWRALLARLGPQQVPSGGAETQIDGPGTGQDLVAP